MSDEARRVPRRLAARSRAHHHHIAVDTERPHGGAIPGSSVTAVQRVVKFDGRTRTVAARRPGGVWYRVVGHTRFSRATAETLRDDGISEVVLKRGLRQASFPLGWMSRRT